MTAFWIALLAVFIALIPAFMKSSISSELGGKSERKSGADGGDSGAGDTGASAADCGTDGGGGDGGGGGCD